MVRYRHAMHPMPRDQAMAFLAEGTRTGKLATIRRDGSPNVAPIWFVVDGDSLVFNTWHTSAKAGHMRRNPKVSLAVDLEEPPYAYVTVQATAEITDDLDDVRRYATMIGARYMGEDQAEAFGERNGVEGELLVRLHIDKIIAFDDVSG